ncbi:hypothetical protein [Halobacterium noricense]|uniref:hypothetical protein n=1 Tax=Halobacterium noricense TaxID=223182 RepID=UPI001E4F0528|nr:hypothetical protein [Halobacterium noricense]UHH25613.1 hypothetical protein LT974_01415 [Halobacterium noricense]
MDVLTIALGVALGVLLLDILLILLSAVVVGAFELYEYLRPERTLLYEIDPAGDSIAVYEIEDEEIVVEGGDAE